MTMNIFRNQLELTGNNNGASKALLLLLIIVLTILAVGCSTETSQGTPEETAAILEPAETVPITGVTGSPEEFWPEPAGPTATPTIVSPSLTLTPTMRAEPTVVTETAVPTPSVSAAIAGEDGKIYLGDMVLLDIRTEAQICFHDVPAEISYSVTNDHFLVIPFCIEGDNLIFIFSADGTGKKEVTGPWDYLNGLNYEWAPDGQSFMYERIDSCCLAREDIPADAPPRGMVRYDVVTGEKELIVSP